MSERKTFMKRVLDGEVLDLGCIDEEIARWHDTPEEISMSSWLGMTDEEYGLFVERPDALRVILMARKYGRDLRELLRAVDSNATSLAARGASEADVANIRKWLEQTGRI